MKVLTILIGLGFFATGCGMAIPPGGYTPGNYTAGDAVDDASIDDSAPTSDVVEAAHVGGQDGNGIDAEPADVPGPTGDSLADADAGKGQNDAGPLDSGAKDSAVVDAAKNDTQNDILQKDQGPNDLGPADTGPKENSGAMTSPTCIDGQYSEVAANPSADISAALAKFSASDGVAFVTEALGVRYPLGKFIMQSGDANGGGCIKMFWQASQGTTPADAILQASTLVHECGHMYDNSKSSFGDHDYFIRNGVEFKCKGLAYQGANKGFARSLIKGDEFNVLWPACANFGDLGCDGYAPSYLDGDPKDGKFDSGDQGYDMVLEEVTQYVNSLATSYAVADQTEWNTSAEDGILTYMWYTERYLHMARLQFPDAYNYLIGNSCWRQATLTIWGRGWFYLNKSAGNSKLNLIGPQLRDLVKNPVLIDEIVRLRKAEGCK